MSRSLALLLSGLLAVAVIRPDAAQDLVAESRPSTRPAAFDVRPAEQALRRLVPRHADQVRLRAVPRGAAGDHFRVSGRRGRIVVEGSSPAVLLTGFNAYLGEVAGGNISWAGVQLQLPVRLPAPRGMITRAANVPHRFALNDTNDGYTGPYWDWPRWERALDVLALHGVNEILVYAGQEAVYYETFRRFGYSDAEIRNWIPPPGHQPWWLLQNMCCFPGAISKQLLDARAELGRKIVNRLRELGITPVLPGYFGTVPPSFVDKNPGARVVPQGDWGGFRRPDWLDPRTPHFGRVAEAFYAAQRELFGDSTMFKMDLLHEGGTPGDVPVPEAARAIEHALQTARPGAVWALLGWESNPSLDLLRAIDDSKVLVLDALSDRYADLDRERRWAGTPYTFGTIPNFGGHTTIGANLAVWNERYWQWKRKPGSALAGIAIIPEASHHNPVAFDFFMGLAWRDGPTDLAAWFAGWADRRYGGEDAHARAAWQALRTSAYAMSGTEGWSEPADSLFAARPSLTAGSAAAWSPTFQRYDTAVLDRALPQLLAVRPELRRSDAYRYDLSDLTRQVLANRSRPMLRHIAVAFQSRDRARLAELSLTWLRWMDLLDRVVATDHRFLLGPWLEQARRWARDERERAVLEYDARSLLSVWGERAGSEEGLHDYANREWAGLIKGLYLPRWQRHLTELSAALAENRSPRPIDWYAMEESWARQRHRLPTQPVGDPYAIAGKVLSELRGSVYQGQVEATVEPTATQPGRQVIVTATFHNLNGFSPASAVKLSLAAPNTQALDPTDAASVAPGERLRARWKVTLGAAGTTPVTALQLEARFRYGQSEGRASTSAKVLMANGVQPPLRTAASNGAVFGQVSGAVAIHGGATNEFSTAYLPGGLVSGSTATVTVTDQDPTGPWARAGLAVRDELGRNGAAGYLNLALTPSNGCVLSWDADGDGKLDQIRIAGGFSAPVRLRLVRNENVYVASCGTDTQWTDVGTAVVTGAVKQDVGVFMTGDVGVFMTAANPHPSTTAIAQFADFTVTAPHTSSIALQDRVTSRMLRMLCSTSNRFEAGRGPVGQNLLSSWKEAHRLVSNGLGRMTLVREHDSPWIRR